MEVVMSAEKGTTPDADTFVSLRIGQVQRHARFAPVRTYRFDELGSGKANAKLEVFKRIGHTTVTFGGSTGDIQDVEVPVQDGKPMRMRLSTSNARAATPAVGEKKKSRHVNGARNYLAQHNLEEIIKDSMKEVMNMKPVNPYEFLAAYILGRGNGENSYLPRLYVGPEKQTDMPKAPSTPVKLPPIVGRPLAPEQCMPDLPMWTEPVVQPVYALQAHSQRMPSVATWYAKKPPQIPFPVKEFKFRPSVGTWCTMIVKEIEVLEEPIYRKFTLRPSVGTWLAPPPCEELTDQTSYRKWQLRPSVGSWCAPNPIMYQSLDELTSWRPSTAETAAMNVIMKGRATEIRDLSRKLREVSAGLNAARATGSATVAELENTAVALEHCVSAAQNEFGALQEWSTGRGFSQPASPQNDFRNI